MCVNVRKVIESSLREGQSSDRVIEGLRHLARLHMIRHFEGLMRDLYLDPKMTRREFYELYHSSPSDSQLKRRFRDVQENHLYGYFGEIAVLSALGRDWHHVYKANNIHKYDMPDGEVDGYKYDVKSKHKDDDGLSVEEAKIKYDFYILVHLKNVEHNGGYARIRGYTSKGDLLNGRIMHFRGKAARAPYKLHSFAKFLRLFKH